MAYIGKSIESGTFSVLDTSGNTYNGSNTTFNLGTQVGSTAQLLVSHDGVIQKPGTDYTLASGGSQITFTTAPASGASIFIVEISGAVGGTVTPSDNSVGITQLNVSDGSNGQALTTNGSGTLSFSTISTGLTGIDDQSSSNDDQLTITDTAVVINEDSDDVDFRVESNGNANMLFVSGGNDVVGVGAEGDLGVGLHIKSADSGASVSSTADELVIEGSGDSGMSILSGNSSNGFIYFGDDGDNDVGGIDYDHNGNILKFIAGAQAIADFKSSEVVFNEGSADQDFRVESNGNANMLFVNGGTDQVIIGATSTDDIVFDTVVAIEGNGANNPCLRIDSNATNKTAELHLVNPASSGSSSGASIVFGEATTRQLYMHYSFNSDFFGVSTTGGEVFRINQGGTVASGDFNDTSDRGLKENIADIADGISIIKQLKPRTFKWKGEKVDRGNSAGFIAQEVKEVLPNLIDGEEYDESKPLDERTKLSVRTHGIVSYLTKALQESITKIEALEARVTTLEG